MSGWLNTSIPLKQGRIESFWQPQICVVRSSKKAYFTHKRLRNRVKYWEICKFQSLTSPDSNHQPQIYLGVWGVQYAPTLKDVKICTGFKFSYPCYLLPAEASEAYYSTLLREDRQPHNDEQATRWTMGRWQGHYESQTESHHLWDISFHSLWCCSSCETY